MRTIVWFRGKDLRLSDHEPLSNALASGEVIPLFVLDPAIFAPKRAREIPHRIQFLLDSLHALEQELEARGSRLVVVSGRSTEVIPRLARQWKVDRVVGQRWVEPFARQRDQRIRQILGTPLELYEGETLLPPGTLRTGGGKPYAVFTPFARAFARLATVKEPLAEPRSLPPLPSDIAPETTRVPTCDALGITRTSEEAMLWRGWGFYRQGDSGTALRFFRDALKINPLYEDAQYAINFVNSN